MPPVTSGTIKPKVVNGVRVGILGPLEVRDAAGQPVALTGPRLRTLLVRLAVAGGHMVTVDRLAEDLWPAPARRCRQRPAGARLPAAPGGRA